MVMTNKGIEENQIQGSMKSHTVFWPVRSQTREIFKNNCKHRVIDLQSFRDSVLFAGLFGVKHILCKRVDCRTKEGHDKCCQLEVGL